MDIGFRYALSEIRDNFTSLNWWQRRVFVPYVLGTLSRYHPRYPGYDEATHVMEEEWDTLIILDACRADFFEEVADLDRFDTYERKVSLGSHSSEWTRRNFQGKKFNDTVYVSANPHTSLEAGDSFHKIVELWETDFDEELGVVPPEAVKKAAIKAHEEYNDKRLIIHFMQPHGPFIGGENKYSYKRGEEYQSTTKYWDDYRENLEYCLPFAMDLATQIPGETVITADHGQIFSQGFKRILGLYSHPHRLRLPGLVRVPWATIHGENRRITAESITESQGEQIDERLKQLGYL
ncbi:hypothetical protein PM022_18355 [Halorubrum ezzemoulense]|uniref:hypothetical protein n=1 Tax=Halorubrum ezzemoulense TaxID=337243 RepID=UPI00232D144F|nr:hypothetical protein [Halorubrum ezzemoulense]MDB2276453.1 hypothetical protein [Halorubrum ezzemoulense]